MRPTTTYSHERHLSPDEAAVFERRRTVTAGDINVQTAGRAAHPDMWVQPAISAAEGVNSVNQSERRPQPTTSITGNVNVTPLPEQPITATAGNVIDFASKADHLAAARQQTDKAFS